MKLKNIPYMLLLVSLPFSTAFSADKQDFPDSALIDKEMKAQALRKEWSNNQQVQKQWSKALNDADAKRKDVFSQVEPGMNSFPKIEAQRGTGIDIDAIASRYKQKAKAKQNVDGVYAFASLSMPTASLKKLAEDTRKIGGVLVFRGFRNGNYRDMAQAISDLGIQSANIQINPNVFKQYKVEAVPAIVVVKANAEINLDDEGCVFPTEFSKVSGDVSLAYALEEIARQEGKELAGIAGRYQKVLAGGN